MTQRQYFYAVLTVLVVSLTLPVLDFRLHYFMGGIVLLIVALLCIVAVVATEVWYERDI